MIYALAQAATKTTEPAADKGKMIMILGVVGGVLMLAGLLYFMYAKSKEKKG